MNKRVIISMVVFTLIVTSFGYGQGFIEAVEDESLGALYGNACILKLESGEVIQGIFSGGTYVKNGLSKITIKLENGEKAKFVPEQVISLQIKSSDLLKMMMFTEAGSSIAELANTDYNSILNREYIIFESALTAKKNDTYRLLQLINPGFNSKIRVFAEPSAKTGGLNVGGLQLTGGEDKAYLFVKGDEKAIEVKKGSYSKDFEELYSDCPKMIEALKSQKIKWDDVALHVFYYDQVCR